MRPSRALLVGVASVAFLSGFSNQASAQAWTPPVGIPTPSFGIFETAPADPSPWATAVSGFYYVCPTCTGATDSSNPLGYPSRPRMTIPTPIPAGGVVRVFGRYDMNHSSPARIQASGSASAPAWIRGTPGNRPTVTRNWEIQSSTYLIVENMHFADRNGTEAAAVFIPGASSFVTLRHNEFSGNTQRSGGFYIYNGPSNIVFYKNNLHNLGNINDTGDQDQHCMALGASHSVWIVDNEMSYCSGDGLQINFGSNNNAAGRYLYIGRNYAHHNKQAGLWAKNAQDVIFSENVIHDHRPSSSAPGACTGAQYGGSRIWWINNILTNCQSGISINSTSGLGDGLDVYMVGNVISHMVHACIVLYNDSVRNRHIVGNTCVSSPNGLQADTGVGTIDIQNNIFSGITNNSIVVWGQTTASDPGTTAHHNLFHGNFRVSWGGTTYTSSSAWQNATVHGDQSVIGDPLFANPATGDYSVRNGSPAIDTGQADADGVYSLYQRLYGENIARNPGGSARPVGNWDIGAFENSGAPRPTAPTNVRIIR